MTWQQLRDLDEGESVHSIEFPQAGQIVEHHRNRTMIKFGGSEFAYFPWSVGDLALSAGQLADCYFRNNYGEEI